MTLTKLNKIIFSLLAFNLLALVFWMGSLWLIRGERAELKEKELAWEARWAEELKISSLAGLELGGLEDYFLTATGTLALLDELEELSKHFNLKLNISRSDDNQGELKLLLRTDGSYSSNKKFLQQLELLPYALRVDRFDLRLNKPKESLWLGEYLLTIKKRNFK